MMMPNHMEFTNYQIKIRTGSLDFLLIILNKFITSKKVTTLFNTTNAKLQYFILAYSILAYSASKQLIINGHENSVSKTKEKCTEWLSMLGWYQMFCLPFVCQTTKEHIWLKMITWLVMVSFEMTLKLRFGALKIKLNVTLQTAAVIWLCPHLHCLPNHSFTE